MRGLGGKKRDEKEKTMNMAGKMIKEGDGNGAKLVSQEEAERDKNSS